MSAYAYQEARSLLPAGSPQYVMLGPLMRARVEEPPPSGFGWSYAPKLTLVRDERFQPHHHSAADHYIDRALLRRFDKLIKSVPRYEARILMHVPAGTPKPRELASVPHHFVTTPEICNPDYVNKISGRHWLLWRGGNTDLIGLHFFRASPGYDRYWFLEYNLRFSGP